MRAIVTFDHPALALCRRRRNDRVRARQPGKARGQGRPRVAAAAGTLANKSNDDVAI